MSANLTSNDNRNGRSCNYNDCQSPYNTFRFMRMISREQWNRQVLFWIVCWRDITITLRFLGKYHHSKSISVIVVVDSISNAAVATGTRFEEAQISSRNVRVILKDSVLIQLAQVKKARLSSLRLWIWANYNQDYAHINSDMQAKSKLWCISGFY